MHISIAYTCYDLGGWLSSKVKVMATHLSSPINPAPVVPTDVAGWSVKNTMLAAMVYMCIYICMYIDYMYMYTCKYIYVNIYNILFI
jgi:hypothetical protein